MTNSGAKKILKNIDGQDILMFLGLILIGIGLYLWLGLGVSFSVVGALLFCMGYLSGAVKGKK